MNFRLLFPLVVALIFSRQASASKPDSKTNDSIKAIELKEVVIKGLPVPAKISGDGVVGVKLDQLSTLPQVVGTPDPIRLLQMYPGVAAGNDVNAGLFVRGGDPSQNLMLLNGAPLINVMHYTGFFSTFIPDHLESFTLYKAYISPKFGGRVGGLLEVQAKTHIPDSVTLTGDVGFLASNLTLSVPLGKRSALYLSARRSYVNMYRSLINRFAKDPVRLSYDFGDLNFTWVFKPGAKDEIFLNAYAGGDDLSIMAYGIQADGSMKWSNANASLCWRHGREGELQWENILFHTQAADRMGVVQGSQTIMARSYMYESGFKSNLTIPYGSQRSVLVGMEGLFRDARPQYLRMSGDLSSPDSSQVKIGTLEYALFGEWRHAWNDVFRSSLGLRWSGLIYDREQNTKYGLYQALEPRVLLEYDLSKTHRFHASFCVQRQYLNQVSVSKMGLPSDFWLPSSENIPAQTATGPSLGYRFRNRTCEFSADVFYKKLDHQFFSAVGMSEMLSKPIDLYQRFWNGSGENYGAEFFYRTKFHKLALQLSYTLSWAQRNCEQIDQGKIFDASNDRRHDFSCLLMYPLGTHWDFTANFVFATGQPYTPTLGMYLIGERNVQVFGSYNSARLPDYHRLDVSFSRDLNIRFFHKSRINFSVMNVYGRQNPFFLYSTVIVNPDPVSFSTLYQYMCLFGFLPSVGLSFTL